MPSTTTAATATATAPVPYAALSDAELDARIADHVARMGFINTERFYLGCHRPAWLWDTTDPSRFPLFVSHRTLAGYKTLKPATCDWALDSGGFTELGLHGRWTTTARDYVRAARRYATEIGRLRWAAPQDWMCEPQMLARTGLDVARHQALTVASYLELRWADTGAPVIPVLQGWEPDDYRRHVELYEAHGVDLFGEELVGVGTMCRRSAVAGVARLFAEWRDEGMVCHGFGLKADGIRRFGWALGSTDSLAWSAHARHEARRAGRLLCGGEHRAKSCTNCRPWAEAWAEQVLAIPIERHPYQLRLDAETMA
jgi:hypothetical protein